MEMNFFDEFPFQISNHNSSVWISAMFRFQSAANQMQISNRLWRDRFGIHLYIHSWKLVKRSQMLGDRHFLKEIRLRIWLGTCSADYTLVSLSFLSLVLRNTVYEMSGRLHVSYFHTRCCSKSQILLFTHVWWKFDVWSFPELLATRCRCCWWILW